MEARLTELSALNVSVTYDVIEPPKVSETSSGSTIGSPTRASNVDVIPAVYVAIIKRGQGPWVAEQVSFLPMERPSPQHEVLRFVPRDGILNSSSSMTVSPAFDVNVSLTSSNNPPIDSAIFSCASAARVGEMRARQGRYTICNSKFSRTSALATGGMLLLAGPLGVGNYRLYSRGAIADAVLEANVVPLVSGLMTSLQSIKASTTDTVPDVDKAMREVLAQRVALAMGSRVVTAYHNAAITGIQSSAGRQLQDIKSSVKGSFSPDMSALSPVYPVEGGTTSRSPMSPLASGALAELTVNPSGATSTDQLKARLGAELDRRGLELPCRGDVPSNMAGPVATNVGSLYFSVRCEPFAMWPKPTTGSSSVPLVAPGRPTLQTSASAPPPSVWLIPIEGGVSMPSTWLTSFAMSDASVGLSYSSGNLSLENKTNDYITIKSISLYIGD